MALFASFTGVKCPVYGRMIVVSGIYFDKREPELGVTKCGYGKTEIQVSKNPLTGEIRAGKVKKN
jgi:hypothetical protein